MMEDSIELHAPAHDELNLMQEEIGIFLGKEVGPAAPAEKRTVTVHNGNNLERKMHKSRWNSVVSGKVEKNTNIEKNMSSILSKPKHWGKIPLPGGSTEMSSFINGQILAQKILFADACCGTSTPNWILKKVLKL